MSRSFTHTVLLNLEINLFASFTHTQTSITHTPFMVAENVLGIHEFYQPLSERVEVFGKDTRENLADEYGCIASRPCPCQAIPGDRASRLRRGQCPDIPVTHRWHSGFLRATVALGWRQSRFQTPWGSFVSCSHVVEDLACLQNKITRIFVSSTTTCRNQHAIPSVHRKTDGWSYIERRT
jgi:hypothetical protein